MNIEKNNLTKIYSVNYFPNTIEFSDIKSFYQFDTELGQLRKLEDIKKLSIEVQAFHLQINFKKFYKI